MILRYTGADYGLPSLYKRNRRRCEARSGYICYPKRDYVTKVMGFEPPKKLWGMGCQGVMGFYPKSPLSQVGKAKKLWVLIGYGFWRVWDKRESTVMHHGPDELKL